MKKRLKSELLSRVPALVVCLLVLVLLLPVSTASAARDRTPPTTPSNLRVTGMTPYSVSLAWDPSTDKSGSVTYTICCANVSSETFPGPASSHVYRAGLEAGRSFTLFIVARDAAGNYSKQSNTVTFTLPRDTTPPTKPTVAVTDVGPTHVSLSWSSTEDGPNVWFTVFMNGSAVRQGVKETSGTFGPLSPETTYTFTVRASDFGGNVSPLSDPVTVTTEASNTNDTIPPTTPANFTDNGMSFEDGETWLFWEQSTDNVDPQSVIRYDVYVNGAFDHSIMGHGRTIVYGNPGVENTYQVIAVDSAGNQSSPATLTTCAAAFC
ncbi:MAG TPA: fibronectin type III domain-containing protein, partial [Anaerolineales bacterium]|nr:fibronectin type III domain-containing protein [Anaerolineales bacterium]